MGSTLLSVGINIILAPIFIFWFKWGITGAAVATLLAQVVGMVRVLLHFSDAASTVHFRRGIWQLRKTIVTGILSIGMAPCLVNVCGSAVTVAINRQLADHGGTWPSGPTASSTAFLFCSPCSSSASLRECSPSSATTTEP